MAAEINSFIWKFSQLCDFGIDANLTLNCQNGNLSISLNANMPVFLPLSPYSSSSNTNFNRATKPSRVRRRQRRRDRSTLPTNLETHQNQDVLSSFSDTTVVVDNSHMNENQPNSINLECAAVDVIADTANSPENQALDNGITTNFANIDDEHRYGHASTPNQDPSAEPGSISTVTLGDLRKMLGLPPSQST